MKVRMKVEISGTRDDSPWPAIGGELVVSDREGAELCEAGYAEPVAEPAKVEKAVAPPVAEKRAAKKRS